jgi:predicted  nucleic acid-binding Zn-ribbon protein
MSDKERRTFSIDEDMNERLSEEPNASHLVNELLRHYYACGRSEEAAQNKRLAEKESELKDVRMEKSRNESKEDRLEREIEDIRESLNSLDDKERRQIEAVVGLIEENAFSVTNLNPENELVLQRSGKAGMDAERFIQEVRERLD